MIRFFKSIFYHKLLKTVFLSYVEVMQYHWCGPGLFSDYDIQYTCALLRSFASNRKRSKDNCSSEGGIYKPHYLMDTFF